MQLGAIVLGLALVGFSSSRGAWVLAVIQAVLLVVLGWTYGVVAGRREGRAQGYAFGKLDGMATMLRRLTRNGEQ